MPRPLDAAELLEELANVAELAREALSRVEAPGDVAGAVRAREPFAALDGGPVVAALVERTRLAYAEAEAGDVEALRRAARHLDALAELVADRRRALVGGV